MRHLARMITGVSVLVLWASSIAHAQGQVENVRMSKQPDFDRIVLDLGLDPVDASQSSTTDEFVLELSASRPGLVQATQDKLNGMRVYFEDTTTGGSQLVVDRKGRSVRVFRLVGNPSAGKGDRLVLDVGKRGGPTLQIPGDAARVPLKEVASSGGGRPSPVAEEIQGGDDLDDLLGGNDSPSARPAANPSPKNDNMAGLRDNSGTRMAASTTTETDMNRSPDQKPAGEDVWVLVRAIEIEGVRESPSLSDLRDLELPVSPVNGGYVAPRGDAPVQRIPLRALTGDDSGRRLSGTVLQLIVETIAAAYARNDKLGTKVDIRRTDLDKLYNEDSDGRLVIRVREASQRSAAR